MGSGGETVSKCIFLAFENSDRWGLFLLFVLLFSWSYVRRAFQNSGLCKTPVSSDHTDTMLKQGAQCEAVPRVIPFELHSFQRVFTYLQQWVLREKIKSHSMRLSDSKQFVQQQYTLIKKLKPPKYRIWNLVTPFLKITLSPLACRLYKAADEVHSAGGVTWFPLPVFCSRLLLSCRLKKSHTDISSPCFSVCRLGGSTEWRQGRVSVL